MKYCRNIKRKKKDFFECVTVYIFAKLPYTSKLRDMSKNVFWNMKYIYLERRNFLSCSLIFYDLFFILFLTLNFVVWGTNNIEKSHYLRKVTISFPIKTVAVLSFLFFFFFYIQCSSQKNMLFGWNESHCSEKNVSFKIQCLK